MTSTSKTEDKGPWYMPPDAPTPARPLIRGTAYFVDFNAAMRYYKTAHHLPSWADAADMVRQRLVAREIHLGKPPNVAREHLIVLDSGTRWGIIE